MLVLFLLYGKNPFFLYETDQRDLFEAIEATASSPSWSSEVQSPEAYFGGARVIAEQWPSKEVHSLMPQTVNVTPHCKREVTCVIKGPAMRVPCIITASPV